MGPTTNTFGTEDRQEVLSFFGLPLIFWKLVTDTQYYVVSFVVSLSFGCWSVKIVRVPSLLSTFLMVSRAELLSASFTKLLANWNCLHENCQQTPSLEFYVGSTSRYTHAASAMSQTQSGLL